jgi:hypothetical protein
MNVACAASVGLFVRQLGRPALQLLFHLCKPHKTVSDMIRKYLRNAEMF